MGVVIRGMDLPECCGKCRDCRIVLPNEMKCYRTKSTMDWELGENRRMADCPLKSVDGLIDEIKSLSNANTDYWNDNADTVDREDLIDTIREYCGEEQ